MGPKYLPVCIFRWILRQGGQERTFFHNNIGKHISTRPLKSLYSYNSAIHWYHVFSPICYIPLVSVAWRLPKWHETSSSYVKNFLWNKHTPFHKSKPHMHIYKKTLRIFRQNNNVKGFIFVTARPPFPLFLLSVLHSGLGGFSTERGAHRTGNGTYIVRAESCH